MTTEASATATMPAELVSTADEQRRLPRWQRGVEAALFTVLALFVSYSFGFSWGNVGNQETYFLGGLAEADPALFPRDWLVRETLQYHESFRAIVRALMLTGHVGLAAAIMNMLLTVGGLALISAMLREVIPSASSGLRGVAFLGLSLIIMAGGTDSVGGTYVFTSGLQPSILASVFWLAALLLWMRERWLLSGILLAVGGYWHVNFLILGIPLCGLAHLLLGPHRLVHRWALQLSPSILLLLLQVPILQAAGDGPGVVQAREIMQAVRSPHHYQPLTYLRDFPFYLFWHLTGLLACFALRRQRAARVCEGLLLACLLMIGSATLLTTVVYVPQVSQAFVWRIAPFSVLLSQLMLLSWMACPPRGTLPHEGSVKWVLLALSLGLGIAGLFKHELAWSSCLVIFAITGAGLMIARPLSAARRHAVLAVVGLCALAAAAPEGIQRARHVWRTSTLMPPWQASDEKALGEWIATSPKDALYLIPPDLGTFRLHALRSIVVDWKSTPMLPAELLEWYRRIARISGIAAPRSGDEVVAGYRAMTPQRLASLQQEFGFDYAVFTAPLPRGLPEKDVRYRNGSFVVLQTEGAR